jgi:hypothetical protein
MASLVTALMSAEAQPGDKTLIPRRDSAYWAPDGVASASVGRISHEASEGAVRSQPESCGA